MAGDDIHDVPDAGSDERQHVLARDCWCEPETWFDADNDAMRVQHTEWDYPPGTFGFLMRKLRRDAERLGATHIVDQVDALQRTIDELRDEGLRRYFEDEEADDGWAKLDGRWVRIEHYTDVTASDPFDGGEPLYKEV